MTDLDRRMKLAEGREAEIFAWEGGSVLRLLRRVEGRPQLEHEAQAMTAARAAGVRCPEPRGVIEVDGRPGLVVERIDGPDGLDDIASRPWTLWSSTRAFAQQHALLGAAEAPAGLPSAVDRLRDGIEHSEVPETVRLQALGNLDGLPDGDRLVHGDFHPGNLIWAEDGPVLIDWANASRGDPAADHARTLVLLRTGTLPPGMPLLLRGLAKVARGMIIRSYRRAYNSALPIDPSTLARWELPVAVARVSEAIEEEYDALDRYIRTLLAR